MKVKKLISVTIILILITIIITEIILRLLPKQYISNIENHEICFSAFKSLSDQRQILEKYRSWSNRYLPYLMWSNYPNIDNGVIKINSRGYRGEEWSSTKSESTYRIIFTGGSVAFGYGSSSNKTTISEYLQRRLNDKLAKENINYNVEVYNAAQDGYVSTQEYIQWKDLLSYKPDMIIHFTGYNDVYTGFKGKPAGGLHPTIREDLLTSDTMTALSALISIKTDRILRNSLLYQLINALIKKNSRIIYSHTNLQEIKDVFIRNMELVSDIAKIEQITPVVVIQPSLFTERKKLTQEEQGIMLQQNYDFPDASSYFQKGSELIVESLHKDINQSELIVIDGRDVFKDSEKDIYIDTAHFSDGGNEIVGNELAYRLYPIILKQINKSGLTHFNNLRQ